MLIENAAQCGQNKQVRQACWWEQGKHRDRVAACDWEPDFPIISSLSTVWKVRRASSPLRKRGNHSQSRMQLLLGEALWPSSKAVLTGPQLPIICLFFKLPFFFLFGSKSVGLMPTLLHTGNCLHCLCEVPGAAAKKLRG